jgi:hypothetical protein
MVGIVGAGADGRSVVVAGEPEQSPGCRDGQPIAAAIAVRPFGSQHRHLEINDIGSHGAGGVVAEPQTVHGAGAEVVDHHVADLDQAHRQLATLAGA